jgi:hypothetical protein
VTDTCDRAFLGSVTAPPGWIAYYTTSLSEHPNYEMAAFPVACWLVMACEHGVHLESMIMTSKGRGLEAVEAQTLTTKDGIEMSFLVVVGPEQNAEAMIKAALDRRLGVDTDVQIIEARAEN